MPARQAVIPNSTEGRNPASNAKSRLTAFAPSPNPTARRLVYRRSDGWSTAHSGFGAQVGRGLSLVEETLRLGAREQQPLLITVTSSFGGIRMTLNRRDFLQMAAAMGATLAWAGPAHATRTNWRERRDLYPEGVASGDPAPDSVLLWTRRPFDSGESFRLTVEVATDQAFRRVVATAPVNVLAASDWTCRVL